MSTHLLHLQSEENHHDASSASPAVTVIILTTHPLRHQSVSNATLEMYSIERDADDYDDDDDDGDIDDDGDKDDDCDDNCPAVIMIIM